MQVQDMRPVENIQLRSRQHTFHASPSSPPLSSMATLPGVAAGSSSGRCGACGRGRPQAPAVGQRRTEALTTSAAAARGSRFQERSSARDSRRQQPHTPCCASAAPLLRPCCAPCAAPAPPCCVHHLTHLPASRNACSGSSESMCSGKKCLSRLTTEAATSSTPLRAGGGHGRGSESALAEAATAAHGPLPRAAAVAAPI